MIEEMGNLPYSEGPLVYGNMDKKPPKDGRVEFALIKDLRKDLLDGDEYDKETFEGEYIAERIKKLKSETLYDPKLKAYRPIDYHDIVILMRSTSRSAPVFEKVLRDHNIPIYFENDSGYFQTAEIKLFMALLRLIDNHQRDVDLLAVMRSAIFQVDEDSLYEVRKNFPKEKSFYACCKAYRETFNNALSDRLEDVFALLTLWHEESKMMVLSEFIEMLMVDSGYYHYLGTLKGGSQRQQNLMLLIGYAKTFSKTSMKGLYEFVRFVEKILRTGGDMATAKAIDTADNVVRLMSMHKSKGLQFPIVFLAGLHQPFNVKDTQGDLILHKDLGFGLSFVHKEYPIKRKTMAQKAIALRMKEDQLAEEIRLLYVAMTRAEDKLILTASSKDIEKTLQKYKGSHPKTALQRSRSFLDLLGPLLLQEEPKGREKGYEVSYVMKDQGESSLIEAMEEGQGKAYFKERIKSILAAKDDMQDRKTKEMLNKTYRYHEDTKKPSKTSITSLIEANHQSISPLSIPTLRTSEILSEKKLTAMERGVALHLFLQNLCYDQSYDMAALKDLAVDMVRRKLLSEEERKSLPMRAIYGYLRSSLGQRIQKATYRLIEKPFVLEVKEVQGGKEETVVLQGIMDCAFLEDGQWVLIDYKSGNIHSNEERRNKYMQQVELYKKALESLTPFPVKECYLYSFSTGEMTAVNHW